MTEFSPAPWVTIECDGDLIVRDANDETVAAFTRVYPECAIGMNPDDARLISASPDLLEALTECLEEMKTYSHVAHPGGVAGAQLFNERLSKAFAAIHKARGEQ